MKKFICILMIIPLLVGCGIENNNDEKITIYTTNYATKYIIKNIVKGHANVYTIYDNADKASSDNFSYKTSDPNTFSFSDNNEKLKSVLNADVFVYNGRDKNDRRVLNEIIEEDSKENVEIFDSTLNANRSTLSAQVNLTYNNKLVDSSISDILTSKNEPSMFWISPIETMNVSEEIYKFLLELFPNEKSDLKLSYDGLIYELNSLYSYVDNVYESNTNNVFVSDSYQLDLLHIHYLTNVYTNQKENQIYADFDTNEAYIANINDYMIIDPTKTVSTTDKKSENYFDLLVVLSEEDYANGKDFQVIMKDNYNVIDKVLK